MTKDSPDILRQFFLEEHPNPERIGCPPEETLQAAAENRLPVTDPARLHMAKCSECFAEYRGYRIDWEAKQTAKRRFVGWAVAAALLVAAIGGAFAFSHRPGNNKAPQQIAENKPPHGGLTPPSDNTVITPSPKQEEPQKPSRLDIPTPPRPPSHNPPTGPSSPAPVTNSDELRSATLSLLDKPQSGEPDRARKMVYSLPSENLKLRIVLPQNAQEGPYTVRVTDDREGVDEIASAEGRAVREDAAVALDVKLLLRGKKTGSHYLFVAPKGSDKPEVYDLRVVSEQNPIPQL